MSELMTAYRFDTDKYYLGEDSVMLDSEGNVLLPPDDTLVKPNLTDGYWCKWNDSEWVQEKKPTSCAEAIEQSLSAVSNSPKPHDREVCELLQALVDTESDEYRIKTDSDTLVMSIEKIPEKTFEEVKTEKEQELANVAGQYDQYKCDSMYVISSLGFKINADIRSQTNMQGLIDVLDDVVTTVYKDYDNNFQTVSKANLETMKAEAIENGQNLYAQKWKLQSEIDSATTIEELNAIEIKFEMMDFSK